MSQRREIEFGNDGGSGFERCKARRDRRHNTILRKREVMFVRWTMHCSMVSMVPGTSRKMLATNQNRPAHSLGLVQRCWLFVGPSQSFIEMNIGRPRIQ